MLDQVYVKVFLEHRLAEKNGVRKDGLGGHPKPAIDGHLKGSSANLVEYHGERGGTAQARDLGLAARLTGGTGAGHSSFPRCNWKKENPFHCVPLI